MNTGRDVAVKISKSAFVTARLLAIYPGDGLVVCRSDMKESLVASDRLVGEITLIPEQALIVEQRVMLCIPVSGNLEGWATC